MKTLTSSALCALLVALPLACRSEPVGIERTPLGSGEPGQGGYENATSVDNNVYHAPQYLPGFPTAAMLWPRVVRVRCRPAGDGLQCDGYPWAPWMGRAEYLYFTPVIAAAPTPAQ